MNRQPLKRRGILEAIVLCCSVSGVTLDLHLSLPRPILQSTRINGICQATVSNQPKAGVRRVLMCYHKTAGGQTR